MLYILLPAYNEEQALPGLLKDIARTCAGLNYRIVLVDDGSTDRTLEAAKSFAGLNGNLEIVRHERNKGLGRALWSGFRYILDNRYQKRCSGEIPGNWPDVVFTMDADNTHSPAMIPLLYAKIREGEDLVIASRYAPGGKQMGLSIWRRSLSWGAGKVMRIFFPFRGIKDYSCGYRAYRLEILSEAVDFYGERLLESDNFAAMVELLLKLAPFCRSLSELPLELHYELKQGASKMRVWSTVLGYLKLIVKMKLLAWKRLEWADEWAEE